MDALEKNLWDVFDKKEERKVNEWVSHTGDSYFPPYSDEMEELGQICSDIRFAVTQIEKLSEDYVSDLSEGNYFFGEKMLVEYYQELMSNVAKLEQYKPIIEKIYDMREKTAEEEKDY